MTPYYEHAGVTIYHSDCRELIRSIAADVVITDPPYGIGFVQRTTQAMTPRDDEPFRPDIILALQKPSIVWGENYIGGFPRGGRLVWVKRAVEQAASKSYSDAEIAWTNTTDRVLAIRHISDGCIRQGEEYGVVRFHPAQKPVAVMRWCVSVVPAGVILDPFMGSGTTLVAAKQLGRRAIGIELKERYCEIAANRLSQESLFGGDPECASVPHNQGTLLPSGEPDAGPPR